MATADLMAGLALEVVDVQVAVAGGRSVVRLSVDKPGGVTVDDCAKASELVGAVLERENVMNGPYVLEVMSPGLDRPLRKPDEYRRYFGRRARVKVSESTGESVVYTGLLNCAGNDSFVLEVDGESIEIPYDRVVRARLDPELPW